MRLSPSLLCSVAVAVTATVVLWQCTAGRRTEPLVGPRPGAPGTGAADPPGPEVSLARSEIDRTTSADVDGLAVRLFEGGPRARLLVWGAQAEPEVWARVEGHFVPTGHLPSDYAAAIATPAPEGSEVAIDAQGRAVVPRRAGALVLRAVAPGQASSTVVVRDLAAPRAEVRLALVPIAERTVRIVDAVRGDPVHAEVALFDRIASSDEEDRWFVRTVAVEGEQVIIPYLAGVGRCDLLVTAPGYVPRTLPWGSGIDGAEEQLDGDLVVVLEPDVAVFGTVVDARGQPIAGAEVAVVHRSMFGRRYDGITDARGRYRIGVPAGRVDLSVDDVAFVLARRNDVPVDGQPQDFILVLAPSSLVSGVVTDDAGLPLAHANVELWFDGRPGRLGMRDDLRQTRPARQTRTDQAGRFTFGVTRHGSYDIDVRPDALAAPFGAACVAVVRHRLREGIRVGEDPGTHAIDLRLTAYGHLLVTLADELGLAGDREPAAIPYLAVDRPDGEDALTGIARAPCRQGVPLGFAYVPAGVTLVVRTIPESRVEVTTVEPGLVRSVILGGDDLQRVTGVVFRAGRPVPGAEIIALPPNGEGAVSRGRTDDLGRFRAASPGDGVILFRARDADARMAAWMRWLPHPAGLVLDWPAAVVVVQTDAADLREVVLELRELDGVDVTYLPAEARLSWRAQVGTDQPIELRGIPAGLYRVHYRDQHGNLSRAQDLRVPGASRVTITAGG